MTKKYFVKLPIQVAEAIYQAGQEIELDAETAALYRHALTPDEEPAGEEK